MATKKVGLKADGKLKKGYRYNENGRIVKAKKQPQKRQLRRKQPQKKLVSVNCLLNSPRPVRLGSFYFGIIFVYLYPKYKYYGLYYHHYQQQPASLSFY